MAAFFILVVIAFLIVFGEKFDHSASFSSLALMALMGLGLVIAALMLFTH